jgi:hypothetical protein
MTIEEKRIKDKENKKRRLEELKKDPVKYEEFKKKKRERDNENQRKRLERIKQDPEKYKAYREQMNAWRRDWTKKNIDHVHEYKKKYMEEHEDEYKKWYEETKKKYIDMRRNKLHVLKVEDPVKYREFLNKNNLRKMRNWHKKKDEINKKRRDRWHANRDENNRKQREKYASYSPQKRHELYIQQVTLKKANRRKKIDAMLNSPARDYTEWKLALKRAGY